MSNYLLPTDEKFVGVVAKAIALSQLRREAVEEIKLIVGQNADVLGAVENTLNSVFTELWDAEGISSGLGGTFYEDALAVISAINLELLTSVE